MSVGDCRRGIRKWRWLVMPALLVLFCGCEDGGGSGYDFGDNNRDLAVAIGDSITLGLAESAPSYPARLSSYWGRPVVNAAGDGEHSSDGAGRVQGLLAQDRPGYLLILYGANDVLHFRDPSGTVENLRAIVRAANANRTRPILATLTPMARSHGIFNGGVIALNAQIRAMASQEGVALVDLERRFGNRDNDADPYTIDADDLLMPGGLHPNATGNDLIARAFLDAM